MWTSVWSMMIDYMDGSVFGQGRLTSYRVAMSDREQFERTAQASFGQLLLKAARRLDEVATAQIRALPDAAPVRPAHTRLFPHITHDGIRSTEIAARLGVSKQAVAVLIADLVDWGMVEQVPDPTDGRARLVRWTEQGLRGLVHGLGVLGEFEGELAERVGAERVAVAHGVLAELIAMLDDR